MKIEKHFNGTIIITDPCYMVKNSEDWYDCEFGEELENLGFEDYLTFKFQEDSPQIIDDRGNLLGKFCTDSSMVSVVCLDDLLAYNPAFDNHIRRPSTCTIINGFEGTVSYFKENGQISLVGQGSINFKLRYEE